MRFDLYFDVPFFCYYWRVNNMSTSKLDISELKLVNVEIKYDDEKEEILISSKINPKFKLAVVLYNEGLSLSF